LLFVATLAAGLSMPAAAVDLPPAAERVLWCASAFNWLARDADDVGDAAGAEILDAWSLLFTDRATAALQEASYGPAEIDAAIASSDREVLEEMQAKTMRHDVEECPELEGGGE
jgi:hypothetical protein